MKVLLDLKEPLVKEILLLASHKHTGFESMVIELIKEGVAVKNRQLAKEKYPPKASIKTSNGVLEELMKRVTKLKPGAEFVVKELVADKWDEVHNTISFGHKAAKLLQHSGMVSDIPSTTSSRRYVRL